MRWSTSPGTSPSPIYTMTAVSRPVRDRRSGVPARRRPAADLRRRTRAARRPPGRRDAHRRARLHPRRASLSGWRPRSNANSRGRRAARAAARRAAPRAPRPITTRSDRPARTGCCYRIGWRRRCESPLAPTPRSRCCCWISTASRRSTTRSGITPAIASLQCVASRGARHAARRRYRGAAGRRRVRGRAAGHRRRRRPAGARRRCCTKSSSRA